MPSKAVLELQSSCVTIRDLGIKAETSCDQCLLRNNQECIIIPAHNRLKKCLNCTGAKQPCSHSPGKTKDKSNTMSIISTDQVSADATVRTLSRAIQWFEATLKDLKATREGYITFHKQTSSLYPRRTKGRFDNQASSAQDDITKDNTDAMLITSTSQASPSTAITALNKADIELKLTMNDLNPTSDDSITSPNLSKPSNLDSANKSSDGFDDTN